MIISIIDSVFGEKSPKLSRTVFTIESDLPEKSVISLIVLIIYSACGEKQSARSMIVLIVDSAEVNFHLKLSVLPPPSVLRICYDLW